MVHDYFSLHVRRDKQAATLAASGELDLMAAPALRTQLERTWQTGADRVIVDLRDVQFIDSTAIHIILGAHHHAQDAGRGFYIIDGGAQVHMLLSLTGALGILNVVAAPDKLLHS